MMTIPHPFLLAVRDMRQAQMEYNRSWSPSDLAIAKNHERRVDQMLKELLADKKE